MKKLLKERLQELAGIKPLYLVEQDPFQDLYDKQNPNDPKAIPGKHFPDDAAKKRMAQDAASLGKGSSGRITKVQKLKMSDIQDEITINQKVGSCSQPNNVDKCLDDVTISWGNESHTVSFEYGGVIDDYGIDRGVDAEFQADSDDGRWQFILDVQGANGIEDDDCNPCIQGYDWDELIIQDHPDDESHLDPEDRSDYDPVVEIEDDEDLRLEPEDDEYEDGTEFEDDDLRLEPEDDYVDKFKLEKLTFDQIVNAFPNNYQDVHFTRKQPNGEEGPYYRDGINFPNMDDSLTHIGDANAWEDWKKKTMRHYGNVEIVLNDQGKNWFDKVFVSDDKFNGDKDSFIRGKMKALNR